MKNLSNSRKNFEERFSGKTSTHRRYEPEGKVLGRVPKIGCEESRIRKVGKTHFRAAFQWTRRQAGNPLSERGHAGKIFFDFA